MGQLACACARMGMTVMGSDSGVYSPMREQLSETNIQYYDSFDESNITSLPADTKVVVGNALSRGNVELEIALERRLTLMSMPDLVRTLLIRKHTSIVISGTHGKTTTSSMCAWVLDQCDCPTGFFIGGVTRNFGTGCRPVPTTDESSLPDSGGYFVTEGDEYDTAYFDKRSKFLSYRPDIAVINNIEFDHADIFSSLEQIIESFRLFARLVPRNGLILARYADKNVDRALRDACTPIESFGFEPGAYWRAVDVDYTEETTYFTVLRKGLIFGRFRITLAGEHSVLNALVVIATALRCGCSPEKIQEALLGFHAPKRRLELIGSFNGAPVVDDFGHHPTAIQLTIGAARQRYPHKRVVACFEPRSNTTTRRFFQDDFVRAFADADSVILGCVHRPDRYPPEQRLDRDVLAEQLREQHKSVFVVPQELSESANWATCIRDHLSHEDVSESVILLLSNGDFGSLRSLLVTDSRSSTA